MSNPAHILIVDDEAASRDILIRRLGSRGYDARGCEGGVTCLEAVERRMPDLILLDVCMPQMDGIAVLGQLRSRWSQDLLPVIFVTARIDSEDIVAGLDAGANDYVVKPVNLPILLARIATHLRIKQLAASSARARELQQANAQLAAEIVERRRMEQAFHHSEERFAKAFRASPDGLALSHRDNGKLIDINESFERMFGFTRDELLGHSGLELGIITRAADRDRAIHQIRTTGSLKDFEAPARRKNTEEFPVSVTAESLDIAGEPCILMIVRDITERYRARQAMQLAHDDLERRVAQRTADLERANQALRESEHRFRNMADNSPMLLWIDGTDGACQFLNKSWLTFTGRTMEQELGWGWVESVHPDDRQRCLEGFTHARQTRDPYEIEYRLCRGDGEYRWILDASIPRFTPDGEFAGYMGSCIDVTERRAAEQLLRETARELERRVHERTAELARSNARLTDEVAERKLANQQLLAYQAKLRALAAQIAVAEERERRRIARGLHDEIGQSLALMKMRLGSLREVAANEPDKAKDLEEIRSALDKAIVHIRSLTFELGSRILYEFGLETAIENLAEQMHRHGLGSTFHDDRQPKPLDEEIRVIVFQAARELLHNVAKHSGAKRVDVSITRTADNYVCIEVHDDGKGLNPQKAGHALTTEGGFGLFNVRQQLDYIGGRLEIQSAPGQGTRTTIIAPIKRAADRAKDPRSAAASPTPSSR